MDRGKPSVGAGGVVATQFEMGRGTKGEGRNAWREREGVEGISVLDSGMGNSVGGEGGSGGEVRWGEVSTFRSTSPPMGKRLPARWGWREGEVTGTAAGGDG